MEKSVNPFEVKPGRLHKAAPKVKGVTVPSKGRYGAWGLLDAVGGIITAFILSAVMSLVGMLLAGILDANYREQFLDPAQADELAKISAGHPLIIFMALIGMWMGLYLSPVFATYLRGAKSLKIDFGLSFKLKDLWVGLLLGLALRILFTGAGMLLDYLGVDLAGFGNAGGILSQENVMAFILLVVASTVIAPYIEEVHFRGLWLQALKRKGLHNVWAILISSTVFALMHINGINWGSLWLFSNTLLVGVVCALLTLKTGRLGGAIVTHITFNFSVVVLALIFG